MKTIYLVCAVPGSGKTWVCERAAHRFTYVPHDSYPVASYGSALMQSARTSDKPILAEAPFRISVLIEELKSRGAIVKPYFIIESPNTVKSRYEGREHKPIPKQHLTRINTVIARVSQYNAPSGNSAEVLKMLLEVPL